VRGDEADDGFAEVPQASTRSIRAPSERSRSSIRS
jgi:hypothetical protein